jgi:hypothetical protein
MVAELYALMLADLAVTLAYLGYIDQARSRLNEALSEARRIRHAETLAEVLLRANWIAAITGSPEMQRQAEELLTVSTEYGFPMFLGWAKAFHGKSLTALGQAHKGLTLLTQGGSSTCYRNCYKHVAWVYVARRGLRYSRAAGRWTELPRRGPEGRLQR